MRKVVQSGSWFLQLVLLCQLWQLGTSVSGGPQYSSMGIHTQEWISSEDIGKIAVFILYVVVSELGKKLDKGYRCPLYCEVDHKHIYEEKESNLQGTDRIPRPDKPKDREQPEGNIRPVASTD